MLVLVTTTAHAAPSSRYSPDPNTPPNSTGPGGVWPKTVQGNIHRMFTAAGPHAVKRSQNLHPCGEDVYGVVQKFGFWLAGGNDGEKMRCTSAFPHGLESPFGMMYYYPADLKTMAPAPVIVWLPGLDGDAGQYDQLAELWASRGFVVAIPYNFVNSFPTDDLWGAQALLTETARVGSPLYRKVDLGKTILGGHSGGAGATFWGASYLPPNTRLLSPALKIIGALSVATGINAPTGLAITVPTLTITGNLDIITPDFLWPRWIDHKTIFQAPAYIATSINGTHFAVNSALPNNPVAGLSMAWLEHLVGGHRDADRVFVGRRWELPKDASFIAVERNALADRLR
ncbi:putative hydrolase [Gordonia effusa NBRC 100432]|uniref:Putative hydrolase n=1 Tax=Gordonia effusa NBRC 100432 TaxID=1077974 RepID=H0QVI6_9ACTN|nr:putative hydrolase [Gordonia effusa NBRC 100432]